MRYLLRVFADAKADDANEYIRLRGRLFRALTREFASRAAKGDAYVEIRNAAKDDVHALDRVSAETGVGYQLVVESHFTRSELLRSRLVDLAIEGEFIDGDRDGNPLNEYPRLLCSACSMPDEGELPVPYLISRGSHAGARWDHPYEGPFSFGREIWYAECGVFVVRDRVRSILQRVIGDEIVCVPAEFIPGPGSPPDAAFWAIRARQTWGVKTRRVAIETCPRCGRPTVARLREERDPFRKSAIHLKDEQAVSSEILTAEGWFGDRNNSPFGFFRDVLHIGGGFMRS